MSAMIRSTYLLSGGLMGCSPAELDRDGIVEWACNAAHPHGAWHLMSVEERQDWREKIEHALESVGAFDALKHECDCDGGPE